MVMPLKRPLSDGDSGTVVGPDSPQEIFAPAKRQDRGSTKCGPARTPPPGLSAIQPTRPNPIGIGELRDQIVSHMDIPTAAAFARTCKAFYKESVIPVFSDAKKARTARDCHNVLFAHEPRASGNREKTIDSKLVVDQKAISSVIMIANARKLKSSSESTAAGNYRRAAIISHIKESRNIFDPDQKKLSDDTIKAIAHCPARATPEAIAFFHGKMNFGVADAVRLAEASLSSGISPTIKNTETMSLRFFEAASALNIFRASPDKKPEKFQEILDKCGVEPSCYGFVVALSDQRKIDIPEEFRRQHSDPKKYGVHASAPLWPPRP